MNNSVTQSSTENLTPQNQNAPTSSTSLKSINPGNKPTYSQATKQQKIAPITEIQNPTDEQGLVFNCVSDYKIRDYLVALTSTKIIEDPSHIIAVSKVSRNRLVIHLKSKEILNSFFQNYGGFQIEETYIKCRRLTSPIKKIIFSHVNPSIPNNILNDYIINHLNLEITTPLSYLRLNPHDTCFGHILSWRRQFYTNTEFDPKNIPGSFLIQYNDQNHRIFITLDEFTCFRCHNKGHRAEDCPQEREDIENNEDNIYDNQMETEENTFADVVSHATETPQINDFAPLPSVTTEPVKRPLSESSTSQVNEKPKEKRKKHKSSKSEQTSTEEDTQSEDDTEKGITPPTIKEIFAPLEDPINKNQEKYPLTFKNFTLFVDMCKGPNVQNISQIIEDLQIKNLEALINMLKETKKFLQHRGTKIKFTKIIKKLEIHQK